MKTQIESINKETYLHAQKSLNLLIKGIGIYDDDDKLIGWVEKPDTSAIKYAIDKYNVQEMKKNK